MKRATVIGSTAMMLIAGAGFCAEDFTTKLPVNDLTLTYDQAPPPQYHSHQVSLDAFSVLTLGQSTANLRSGGQTGRDVMQGTGTGLNYFFTRNLGVATEGYTEDPRHRYGNAPDGSMVLRFPLGKRGFTAYIFGGAGRQYETNATSFHSGGGLEYRFTRHFEAFVEPRVVFKQSNLCSGRCGMRWTF